MCISVVPNVFSFERHSELVLLLRISSALWNFVMGERKESLDPFYLVHKK